MTEAARRNLEYRTILDTIEADAFAETIEAFDEAVNELGLGTYRPDILEKIVGR